ncbi:PepSY-like domain-containing protein [Autumnicola musiva]|uniref:PepSY-like domain-containing protein n=1 Tax=Autumnicola musiva TaxID=3075589 RepID=A0ABU3D670_9FLAO|nr:PepSY-like domain-containing protein [Zunongwangia sp. F117]MDT0676926.1 PepSY-like domain-containing protein [Zunongwangia sp. F117]
MKTILYIFALAVFFNSCKMDDERPPEDLPSVVLNTFQKNFPDAVEVEWGELNDDFEVDFEVEKKDYTAVLTNNGEMKMTGREVSLVELPQDILSSAKQSFPEFKITEADYIEKTGKKFYRLEIENKQEEKNIFIDENGEISKENLLQ